MHATQFTTPKRNDPTDPATQAAHKAKLQGRVTRQRLKRDRQGRVLYEQLTECKECEAEGKPGVPVHAKSMCQKCYRRMKRSKRLSSAVTSDLG